MPVFTRRGAWLERAAFLRMQVLASAGLLPMPQKRPIHAEVFGRLDRNEYSIEKVLLETYPGFYLGGNLNRPKSEQRSFPAVVSPHGHWTYGRLENQQLASVPGRCINLARQGFLVFSYDMIGYNDTDQIPHHWASKAQDLWNVNPLGVQLWDSIRAVDFVSSLPDVDPSRIAVTGASGGATQMIMLMAVDDRIKAAVPVNMISSEEQGGMCENAANLRVGGNNDTSNMVIAALMAPRPLLMVSASDWTHNTLRVEFPAVRSIYRLFGAEQNVESVYIDEVHNYNRESREAMYTFLGSRLLGTKGPVLEKSFIVEQPRNLLALFGRERPAGAVRSLEQFTAVWVIDRGMVSEENVEFLKQEQRRYIVGTPKLLSPDCKQVQAGLEVRLCPAPGAKKSSSSAAASSGGRKSEPCMIASRNASKRGWGRSPPRARSGNRRRWRWRRGWGV